VFPLDRVGDAHQLMYENAHPPGNMSILVNATEEGHRDIDLG
jgi:crotonyl-CoA carboxylase/reductase